MGIKRQKYIGIRRITVFAAAFIVLVAAGLYYQPASAQNPGLKSNKGETPLPAPAAIPQPEKEKTYTVVREQIDKEIILTGELRAANSTVINVPDIRSSFSNMVTYLAPEGKEVKKGERIVEFDDSSLASSKSEAERTLDEAKLSIEKKKADLEADRCETILRALEAVEPGEPWQAADRESGWPAPTAWSPTPIPGAITKSSLARSQTAP